MVDAFKFLCVHGFGGYDENPQLSRQTSTAVARLKRNRPATPVVTSARFDVQFAAAQAAGSNSSMAFAG